MSDNRLILFVTGDAPRSRRARQNLRAALDRLDLQGIAPEEVDVIREPQRALALGLFANPALVLVTADQRSQFLYGDLSDAERLDAFLEMLVTPSG